MKLLIWGVVAAIGVAGIWTLAQSSYQDTAECTGSMDPAITCFDVLTFAPATAADIKIGTVIDTPYCEDPDADFTILHRVINVRDVGRGPEYLTRGDNNSEADSCWTPLASVPSYVSVVEKHYPALGMAQLEKIWEMEDELDAMGLELKAQRGEMWRYSATGHHQTYNDMLTAYNDLVEKYNNQIKDLKVQRSMLQDIKDGM